MCIRDRAWAEQLTKKEVLKYTPENIFKEDSNWYPYKSVSYTHLFTLNERGLKGHFWETYLRPSIDNFQSKLKALSPLEKKYFYAIYNLSLIHISMQITFVSG